MPTDTEPVNDFQQEGHTLGGRQFGSVCRSPPSMAGADDAVDYDPALERPVVPPLRVSPGVLRPLVPDVLSLDTYQQHAWVSVTPFWINHLRPPGVPSLPRFSHFAEINVRTYVTRDGNPGLYFFSLDASNLAVWGARLFHRLPYWQATMKLKGRGGPVIDYTSKRQHGPQPAELRCSYGPVSSAF